MFVDEVEAWSCNAVVTVKALSRLMNLIEFKLKLPSASSASGDSLKYFFQN
jgi:hypothetical protein